MKNKIVAVITFVVPVLLLAAALAPIGVTAIQAILQDVLSDYSFLFLWISGDIWILYLSYMKDLMAAPETFVILLAWMVSESRQFGLLRSSTAQQGLSEMLKAAFLVMRVLPTPMRSVEKRMTSGAGEILPKMLGLC